MSLTDQQKAYHLRKMRTAALRFDTDKDGNLSREDFVLMGQRLVERGNLTEEQARLGQEGFMKYADLFELKPGMKIPLDDIAHKVSDTLLDMSREERKAVIYTVSEVLFDVMDLNKKGYISLDEFKVHYQILGMDIPDEDATRSFKTIDTNKDGKISREDFCVIADDFYNGVDETETSNVLYGFLLD